MKNCNKKFEGITSRTYRFSVSIIFSLHGLENNKLLYMRNNPSIKIRPNFRSETIVMLIIILTCAVIRKLISSYQYPFSQIQTNQEEINAVHLECGAITGLGLHTLRECLVVPELFH